MARDSTVIVLALVGVGAYLLYKQKSTGTTTQQQPSPLTSLLDWLLPTASANVVINSAQTPPASTQQAIPMPAVAYVGNPSGCWPSDVVHVDDPTSVWGYSIAPIPAGASYCSTTDSIRALFGTVGPIPANTAMTAEPTTTATTFIGPIQAPIQNVGP